MNKNSCLEKQVENPMEQVNRSQMETKQLLSGKRSASDAGAEKACRGGRHPCDQWQSGAPRLRWPAALGQPLS